MEASVEVLGLKGCKKNGRIEILKSVLCKWMDEQDGGSPWSHWGAGLLGGADRVWEDGTPVFLVNDMDGKSALEIYWDNQKAQLLGGK